MNHSPYYIVLPPLFGPCSSILAAIVGSLFFLSSIRSFEANCVFQFYLMHDVVSYLLMQAMFYWVSFILFLISVLCFLSHFIFLSRFTALCMVLVFYLVPSQINYFGLLKIRQAMLKTHFMCLLMVSSLGISYIYILNSVVCLQRLFIRLSCFCFIIYCHFLRNQFLMDECVGFFIQQFLLFFI